MTADERKWNSSSQGSDIQCRNFDSLISNVVRSFQELRIAARSVNSDCKHLYTVLDTSHPVLQYFDINLWAPEFYI